MEAAKETAFAQADVGTQTNTDKTTNHANHTNKERMKEEGGLGGSIARRSPGIIRVIRVFRGSRFLSVFIGVHLWLSPLTQGRF
jgi:hypothetical protein